MFVLAVRVALEPEGTVWKLFLSDEAILALEVLAAQRWAVLSEQCSPATDAQRMFRLAVVLPRLSREPTVALPAVLFYGTVLFIVAALLRIAPDSWTGSAGASARFCPPHGVGHVKPD